MPEGDTIFRAARTLDRALSGKAVVGFESVLPALTRVDQDAPIIGRTIERVRSTGKHLLMKLGGCGQDTPKAPAKSGRKSRNLVPPCPG